LSVLARLAQIGWCLPVPICLKESVLALARQYPDLCVSTAGVHPHDAKDPRIWH
jgi:Tat protein secretion system quality control protein TatD with DNase activity